MKPSVAALRLPLLALAAALLAGGVAVCSTGEAMRASGERLAAQQDALAETRRRILESGVEREAILRYLPAYQRLQQQGFIGAEPRIAWLDALREASRQARLPGVDFRIEARQPGAAPMPLDTGRYRLRQSAMKLGLELLHEEDLLHFIAEAERSRAGIFALRDCAVQRAEKDAGQPQLQAECTLVWYTLEEAER